MYSFQLCCYQSTTNRFPFNKSLLSAFLGDDGYTFRMMVVISALVKNWFTCVRLYFTRSCPSTFTNSQYVQVISPHFGCNLCKFPSFIHSTYVEGLCAQRLCLVALLLCPCVFLQDRVVGPMSNPLCLEGQGFFRQSFLPVDKPPTKADDLISEFLSLRQITFQG